MTHRPVESHSGVKENILAGPLLGKFFLNFSFENSTICSSLCLGATAGPPNVAGPEVTYPPYPILSTGLMIHIREADIH